MSAQEHKHEETSEKNLQKDTNSFLTQQHEQKTHQKQASIKISKEMKRELNEWRSKNWEEDLKKKLKKTVKVKSVYLKIIRCELIKIQHAEAAQESAEDRKRPDYSD